ncbi:hypothetical protein ZIOFF_070148 [Zingiber officinale]|uniref:dUTP diphosphatase n=1 Tax=Zingiber officinale TaxID=94328 RepID=A0A8J5ESA6_ZINOF|nr:hypothetical protein ZIOFF_070148 [Zingiber officinale]
MNNNYSITKGTNSYKEAVKATEQIESPAIGFARPSDFQGPASGNSALIKQGNTQIQLLIQIVEGVQDIQTDLKTILEHTEKGIPSTTVIPEDLLDKIKNLSLGPTKRPKESKGKLRVCIQILHRQEEGTMTFVVFRDNRWCLSLLGDTSNGEVAKLTCLLHGAMESEPCQDEDIPQISLSFSNYKATTSARVIQYNARDEEVQSDEKSFHTLAILIEKALGVLVYEDDYEPPYDDQPTLEARTREEFPFILGHKLSVNAFIPQRKTYGAIGFDLVASETLIIETRGQSLVPTGLTLEIPWGTYGHIATRLCTVWKFGLDISARVIDCDYKSNQGFNLTSQSQLTPSHKIPKASKHAKRPKASVGRWDTLGEPSGKFDYYVNYAIPAPLPDLELPSPSWDDEPAETQSTQETPPILDILLLKELHVVLTLTNKSEHFRRDSS